MEKFDKYFVIGWVIGAVVMVGGLVLMLLS